MSLTWTINFDWGGVGVYDDGAFSRTSALKISRGRKTMFTEGKGFTRQSIGQCLVTVDNEDGQYDFLNTASPYYPNVGPGKDVLITVNDGVTNYPVFQGKVAEVTPMGEAFARKATIRAQDGWAQLQNKISHRLVEGEDTGALITRVLDKAGHVFNTSSGLGQVWRFPTRIGETSRFGPVSATRDIGVGTDTVDYWWLREVKAADAINDLVESEFGLFWFAADGKATFLGRHAMYAQASLATLTESTFLRGIATRQGLKNMRNQVYIKAYPKVLQNLAVLWKLNSKPLIKAGESVTYWPDWKYENRRVAAKALADAAATTDYTANSAADGSGSDLTANMSISVMLLGESGEVVVTNSGATDADLTFFQLRGVAVDTPDVVNVQAADYDSIDAYQPQELSLDLKWQDSAATAQAYADYLKGWLPQFMPFPMVQIEARPEVQFAYDLFDRLTVQIDSLGIDQDFRIGGIEHEWLAPTGQGVRTTWYLEPVHYIESIWQFPTQIGVTSRFGF